MKIDICVAYYCKNLMLFDYVALICVFGIMVLNVTFNNISIISWRVVLLVEEIGVPRENYQLATSH
jgi:uncharacterized membrane protein